MKDREREREPMCETSERCERLFTREEILPLSLEIGRRVMEVFGFQRIANIVFRLRSTSAEINAVINGEMLPSTEMLLGIHKTTGASIDWILTGTGSKFGLPSQKMEPVYEILPTLPPTRSEREGERAVLYLQ